jgi:Holliday junction resolvase-like predicted endonuclease
MKKFTITISLLKKSKLSSVRKKSSPKKSNHSKKTGQEAEFFVQKICREKNLSILAQNIKIRGIECDLIVETPDQELWLLEVKTLNNFSYLEYRVSELQRKRLLIALESLINRYPQQKVRAHLVTLDAKNKATWHFDFLISF